MKNVLTALAKSDLIPLGLTAAAATATDATIQKKIFELSLTTLIISKEEINYVMKMIKSFEYAGLLIKGVPETIENRAKEEKGKFFGDDVKYIRGWFLRKSINR